MSIGKKIIDFRKSQGISRKELAARLNIPYTTLRNYETDDREPSLATLGKIAKALGTNVYEMIGQDWSGIDMSDAFTPEAEAKKEPAPISESGSNKARLLAILNQLSDTNQAQLLSYAEFLKDSERK